MACIYTYKGKQYSEQEIKDIVFKEKVKPEDIKFATLDDIANILAYSNSKIILDGWKVEYSTPLGNKYDTLEEVNNEIRGLADSNVEVDLSGVKVDTTQKKAKDITEVPLEFDMTKSELEEPFIIKKDGNRWIAINGWEDYQKVTELSEKEVLQYYNNYRIGDNLNNFIEKNKEYEQSKEIIEQWKKENNIQYDPEEVYSRGQGFYSSIGAYSNLELDLLLKNLIQHIEDNKKASEFNNEKEKIDKFFDNKTISIFWKNLNSDKPYITIYSDKGKVGNVSFYKVNENTLELLGITIENDFKNQKIATNAYKWFLNNLPNNINSILSQKQNQINKKEIPNIYNNLRNTGYVVKENINNFILEKYKNENYGFTISAFTKPIDKRLKHIEGTGDRVKFVIYPKSEHIKWAAPTDVYSGSVWDANTKVSTDKKSELLGVSYTKSPSLNNVNKISPNLSEIIDSLEHAHNELAIELTEDNFEIEFDENIDYSTKQLINSVNKIIQQKRLQSIENKINQLEKQCN